MLDTYEALLLGIYTPHLARTTSYVLRNTCYVSRGVARARVSANPRAI